MTGTGPPAFIIGNAPPAATVNLVVQVVIGLVLVAGALLARRGRIRAHGICQGSMVLLNLIPIGTYMVPVFRRAVFPRLSGGGVSESFYAFPIAHAVVGTVAEVLALYIVLRAGTQLLPQGLRFENYKSWMRTALGLWWLSITLGTATFVVWHVSDGSATGVVQKQPASVTISMSNFKFDPNEVTVPVGTTVVWRGVVGRHTIKADAGGFESEMVPKDGEFSFKFEKEGRYSYHCTLHGAPGGSDMAGTVIVTTRQ